MKRMIVLGSTGSIGENTLDVVRQHRDKYEVLGLAARKSVAKMLKQCLEFQPRFVVMTDASAAEILAKMLIEAGSETIVLAGEPGILKMLEIPEVDSVMCAIVGSVGLTSTLAAVKTGKAVLCANKESLVMAGQLVMAEAKKSGALILPIDSEHSAIFQCLDSYRIGDPLPFVKRLILTASGGPFRQRSLESLMDVTPEQALAHPTWVMGPKISIDSATMMNKALEIIEAHWLFAMPAEKIDVYIHPESTIHSMVEFIDGSQVAQLGYPDMRVPIAVAMAWPERIALKCEGLNLLERRVLHFEGLDRSQFPVVDLAYQAIKTGGTAAASLNAANEVLVEAFLDRKITFPAIIQWLDKVMETVNVDQNVSLATVQLADQTAREVTREYILSFAF